MNTLPKYDSLEEELLRSKIHSLFRGLLSLFLVIVTTALLVWLNASASTAGMVFLALVVWTASQTGIALSLAVALLAGLTFDYYFLPPYHTFFLAGTGEWLSMFSFLACSLVTGQVAERAASQARHAEQRRRDFECLYTLSQEMMLHEDGASLIRELPGLIQKIFLLGAIVLYVQDGDEFYASCAEVPEHLKEALRFLSLDPRQESQGPEGWKLQALMLGLRCVGGLAWIPDKISAEVADAVTAQVAIALTRAVALEKAAQIEAARASERLRTALIDSLSHELRTPLTSIRAAITTLRHSEGLDATGRDDLIEVVDDESARLDALISEAFEMAEIEADVVKVRSSHQHIRAFLEHVIEESRSLLIHHRIVVEIVGEDRMAVFDPHLMSRVFRHLLENSSRYTERGGVITVRGEGMSGRVTFSVSDSGPGIDAVDLPLVFEKFYRGRIGTKSGKGTGMGLAIARAIVMAHGGSISVKSESGKGTTFQFWIPA
jgi:two-component system sensor histidine kinase KdpD